VDRRYVRRLLGLDDELEGLYRRLRKGDPVMKLAVRAGSGLRLMRQEPWECLASFILSSASNIPRIQRCIEGVAEAYGERLGGGENAVWATVPGSPLAPHSFPSPQRMVDGGRRCLKGCRLGYREEYLWETAGRFAREDVDMHGLLEMEYGEARRLLMDLPGVGGKVADCVCLFALGHGEAFPADVWIRRAVGELYMGGESITAGKARSWGMEKWGDDAGYAQQYLYHYLRSR
jgi:N-glycosylase/DNA lyase